MNRPLKRIRRRLHQKAMTGLMRMAPALPEATALRLAGALGNLVARVQPHRRLVRDHLRRAFGEELDEAALRELAAGFYRHVCHSFFEVVRLGRWTRQDVLAATEVVGQEHLDSARDQGKGVIVIGGHLGNWEVGGAGLAQRGYPLAVVSQPQRNAVLQDYLAAIRRQHGVGIIPRSSLRDCFTCLREGGLLVLMIDQRVRQGGVVVPFFGQPASSAPGPAAIALKTGAPVVLIAARRVSTLEDGAPERRREGETARQTVRHRVEIQPPIPLVTTGDRERDIVESTALFQKAVEEAIRRCPEQWLWTHRRWGMKRVQPRAAQVGPASGCPAARAFTNEEIV